jgi:chromosome segregation ATPase
MCVNSLLAVGLMLLASGCETIAQKRAREETRQRENELLAQEQNRRMQGRLQTVEMELQRLDGEIVETRRESEDVVEAELQVLERRLGDLEQQLASLEQQRVKDRQEIIDILSRKVAELMNKNRSVSTGRRSEYGYEHTVEPGQTLSEIAAAYGVSTKAIIRENNLKNPDQLRVGQQLFIPD